MPVVLGAAQLGWTTSFSGRNQDASAWSRGEQPSPPAPLRFPERSAANGEWSKAGRSGRAIGSGKPRTWEVVVGRFERSVDELFDRGAREGARRVLGQLATRRFGEETAGRLAALLAELSEPEDIDRVSDALLECGTGEEFIERVGATWGSQARQREHEII